MIASLLNIKEARDVITRGVAEGMLTEEDIMSLLAIDPTETLKNITLTVHTLFCRFHHDNEEACMFDAEEGNWEGEAHRAWLQYTIKLTQMISRFDDKGYADTLNEVLIEVARVLNKIEQASEAATFLIGVALTGVVDEEILQQILPPNKSIPVEAIQVSELPQLESELE